VAPYTISPTVSAVGTEAIADGDRVEVDPVNGVVRILA
jgi:hypothetical protein